MSKPLRQATPQPGPEMMITLVSAAAAFTIVKIIFGFLDWMAMDEGDKIYRRHLLALNDRFNRYKLFDLAFLVAERISSRLRLTSRRVMFGAGLLLFLLVLSTSYVALLISFSVMARSNPNFDFGDRSLLQVCWVFFREFGFTGSQQISWMLVGTSFSSVFAFLVSSRLLLATRRSTTGWQLALVILKQASVFVIAGVLTLTFVFLSVRFYDPSSNTESQQYLFSQTVRMLYSHQESLIFVLLLNTIASTFPSVLFLLLFLFLAILKVVPDFVRKGLAGVVLRFTKDSNPVLKQIGSFFGALAGLITALIQLIK